MLEARAYFPQAAPAATQKMTCSQSLIFNYLFKKKTSFTSHYWTITEVEHRRKHGLNVALASNWFYSCHIDTWALSPACPWRD